MTRDAVRRSFDALGRIGASLTAFDIDVIDRLVFDGTGRALRSISRIASHSDAWIVGGAMNIIAGTIWAVSIPVRMIQSGSLRSYALLMVIGLIGFLGYYLYLAHHSIR